MGFLVTQVRADEPPTAQTLAETTSRLLSTSQHVAKTFRKEGISPKSIVAQQQLINALAKLLDQSGQAQSATDPMATSQIPKGGDQEFSQGTESGSTAGQAPAVQASPNMEIGDLNQRENFADAFWGHLPPQERNDLLRTYSESYLPGYEKRVQHYFEKLAKLRRRQPSNSPKESSPAVSPQR